MFCGKAKEVQTPQGTTILVGWMPHEETALKLNKWAKKNLESTSPEITNSGEFSQENMNHLHHYDATNLKDLTAEGVVLLAKIVANSPTITTLNISGLHIGDNAVDVGHALANSSLNKLIISDNAIGDKAPAFVEALKDLTSLTTLEMPNNGISTLGEDGRA